MKIIIFKGGLGNQLFQLALYLYLKKFLKSNHIFLDNKIGFLFDFKYHRKFELVDLPAFIKYSNYLFNFFNIIMMIIKRIYSQSRNIFFIRLLDDLNIKEIENLEVFNSQKLFLIDGYFQNYSIANAVKHDLLNIIEKSLLKEKTTQFNNLNLRILNQNNSVALCIRFYEETIDPTLHSNNNVPQKKVKDFNKLINLFEEKLNNPYFFIFVQEENEFTKRLIFNSSHEFVTHKKGYKGSWERLYSQSLCNNHIFNNSTFYFWGAFISSIKNKDKKSLIYMSNNFLFESIYCPKWNTF